MNKVNSLFNLAKEVLSLPKKEIILDASEDGKRLYRYFTRRHSKFFIIRAKTVGVALSVLGDFSSPADYMDSVNGKNSAAYFSRKASRDGYTFKEIDPNEHILPIDKIHHSATHRQGQAIDNAYRKLIEVYPTSANNKFFGIFLGEELLAYLWIVKSGQLALMNRIMGHSDHLKNGIMYLLVTSYFVHELNERTPSGFVMYDTFLGASEGLKLFKKRCGFRPYNVKWKSGS